MRNAYNCSLVITILDTIHSENFWSQEEPFGFRDTFPPSGLNATKGQVDKKNDRK